jgi:hypothetical protein
MLYPDQIFKTETHPVTSSGILINIRQFAQQPPSQPVADLLCANGGCWLEWLN